MTGGNSLIKYKLFKMKKQLVSAGILFFSVSAIAVLAQQQTVFADSAVNNNAVTVSDTESGENESSEAVVNGTAKNQTESNATAVDGTDSDQSGSNAVLANKTDSEQISSGAVTTSAEAVNTLASSETVAMSDSSSSPTSKASSVVESNSSISENLQSSDSNETGSEESTFVAGEDSNLEQAAVVPTVGEISSFINSLGQNEIDIPAGLSEDQQEQWLENAKMQATQDYLLTGREQVINTLDETTDSWYIGDSTRPRVDAVDIASYQSGLTQENFNTMKSLGVKTIIIKLTEGTTYTNPYAQSQVQMALNAGLNVDVYHYAQFSSVSGAQSEAAHLISVLNSFGLSKSILIFADMEDSSTYANDVAGNLNAFWTSLSNAGYTNHGVYTFVSYAYKDAVVSTVGSDRTWMAQYPYSPAVGTDWNTGYGAWQFSSTTHLNGYSGALDVSIDYTGLFLLGDTQSSAANVDHVDINGTTMHIDGWLADNQSEEYPYMTVILFDTKNNQELGRYQVTKTVRPDVENAYPYIYNVLNSGFNVDIPIWFSLVNRDIHVVLRYSDQVNGYGDYVDWWSDAYQFNTNAGSIDHMDINGTVMHIDGWHAADAEVDKPYFTVILFDTKNNQELGRYSVNTINRPDVATAYPATYNAGYSGFNVDIPLWFSLVNRDIHVVLRYSDEPNGYGNYVDWWSKVFS